MTNLELAFTFFLNVIFIGLNIWAIFWILSALFVLPIREIFRHLFK